MSKIGKEETFNEVFNRLRDEGVFTENNMRGACLRFYQAGYVAGKREALKEEEEVWEKD